ncbi:MAG: serine/threonine-protein kinase [Chloroflexota bacterium]
MGLTAGERFAGFRIIRPLGAGGMGEVYLAQHPRLPREEALKVLSPQLSADPAYRQRFAQEADLAAKLWHPHIVEVRDRGETDGQLWISMAYVDGQDAARLLAQKYPAGMPADQVVAIVTAVASALDYAHGQATLHRDVKPANIFLSTPDASGDRRVLLGDFGIARDLADPAGMTATGMTLGTLAYSAPEQLNGDPLDGRADQYALAATAHHLLTGAPLFPVTSPVAAISRHLTAAPPKVSASHPELVLIDDVLAKALSKDPADRYPTCSDFAQALAAAAGSSSATAPNAPTQPAPIPPPVGRALPPPRPAVPRWLLAAAIAAIGALILGLVLWRPWSSGTNSSVVSSSPEASTGRDGAPTVPPPAGPTVPPKDDPDLGLDVPLSRPACNGTGIVILDSATTPGQYRQDVARGLANNPGASYLRTDLSCPSLRQQTAEGSPIYAVYRVAGTTKQALCDAVAAAGPGTYGRWLDTSSDPESPVVCPKEPARGDVSDVDAAIYQPPEYPGLYLWSYSTSPRRECAIYTGNDNQTPIGLWCSITAPPGATVAPEDRPGGFEGPPNRIKIVPPEGPKLGIDEGGRATGLPLAPHRRITVGAFSCTALPGNGVECTAPTGGFRIVDGAVTSQTG